MKHSKLCVFCRSKIDEADIVCPFCGIEATNTNPVGSLALGTVLRHKYTLGRFVSIDGEGIIYEALANDTGTQVLIKEFLPVSLCAARKPFGDVVARPGNEVQYKTSLTDFIDLYKAMLKIGINPGLVRVLDLVIDNQTAYAVTEHIEGYTLKDFLDKIKQKIPFERAEEMLEPVFSGLSSIHDANMLHRGVSPETIIVKSDGKLVLSGYATLALRTIRGALKPQIFPGYTAPEQYVITEFQDTGTDIYGVAAVLYRMVTGIKPQDAKDRFSADNLKVARGLAGNIPNLATSAIHRALRLSLRERTSTILQLLDEFERAPSQNTRSQKTVKKTPKKVSPFVYIIAVMLIISTGIVWYAWTIIRDMVPVQGTETSTSQSDDIINTDPTAQLTPKLTGNLYSDLLQDIEFNQNFLVEAEEKYHADYPAGHIYAQKPLPGEPYEIGVPIKVYVSLGPQKYIVQAELIGLPRAEAVAILSDLGFTVETYETTNTGEYVVGTVMRIDPDVGSEINIDSSTKIRLYIAKSLAGETLP